METSTIKKNVVFAILLQISNTVCGFILPRLLLKSFGAEVYGLTASIAQFVGYVSLLEGGVSGVVLAALYKPLVEHDVPAISSVIVSVKHFFSRLGVICIAYTLALATLYPRFIKSQFSATYIFAMVLVISIRLLVQYFLALTYRLFLIADKKGYIVSITHIIIVWINLLLAAIAITVFDDIIWVKLFSGIIYLIQPIIFSIYVRKHYTLDLRAHKDSKLLSQRWDGFGQNLAYFIHSNTDIVILTFFSSLSNIAVYSVYLMIANAIKSIISVISSAIAPSIGTVLARDNIKESQAAFELYEFAIEFLTFLLYSCGIILLIPFVKIYTYGMNDAEYIQPIFGVLLLLAEMVYSIRDPYVNVAYAKGHFKETKQYAYGEAIINILISVAMVRRFGLVGVAMGTFVSMVIRMFQQVYYLSKNILFRPISKFFKRIILFGMGGMVAAIISKSLIGRNVTNYFDWILKGSLVFAVTFIILSGISFFFYRPTVLSLSKFRRK